MDCSRLTAQRLVPAGLVEECPPRDCQVAGLIPSLPAWHSVFWVGIGGVWIPQWFPGAAPLLPPLPLGMMGEMQMTNFASKLSGTITWTLTLSF